MNRREIWSDRDAEEAAREGWFLCRLQAFTSSYLDRHYDLGDIGPYYANKTDILTGSYHPPRLNAAEYVVQRAKEGDPLCQKAVKASFLLKVLG